MKKHTQTPDEENANISLNDEKPVEENQVIASTQAVMETQIPTFQPSFVEDLLKKQMKCQAILLNFKCK